MDVKVDKILDVSPIGYMQTCFKTKNGTPRQPSVSPSSGGILKIEKSIFTNPEHSLEGLAEFSHVWIIFHFHLNDNKGVKAKVKPPRLNGAKIGVFATRTPHRPNPIGLTLAKLEKVEGQTIHVSGIDIVDGTPILDIKPYIDHYDFPAVLKRKLDVNSVKCPRVDLALGSNPEFENSDNLKNKSLRNDIDEEELKSQPNELKNEYLTGTVSDSNKSDTEHSEMDTAHDEKSEEIVTSEWIKNPPLPKLSVIFSSRAEKNLSKFHGPKTTDVGSKDKYELKFFTDNFALRRAIIDIFREDPRSTYRRNKCSDRLYYITIDNCHVTAWFDYSENPVVVEIVRIKPQEDVKEFCGND